MRISDALIGELCAEHTRQDNKWGEQNHEPAYYLMILGEEVGKANKAALEAHFAYPHQKAGRLVHYRTELIQIAAVTIAMIECLDRSTGKS